MAKHKPLLTLDGDSDDASIGDSADGGDGGDGGNGGGDYQHTTVRLGSKNLALISLLYLLREPALLVTFTTLPFLLDHHQHHHVTIIYVVIRFDEWKQLLADSQRSRVIGPDGSPCNILCKRWCW